MVIATRSYLLFCRLLDIYVCIKYLLGEIFQAKLSSTGDEAWKEREAAVLALGAVAEGCINGLYPLLSEVNVRVG